MKRTKVYLSDSTIDKLEALSKRCELSVEELIRRAVEKSLIKKTSVCPLAESIGCALAEEW